MAQKHLFEHPKWSRNNFGKNLFFAPGTLVDPLLAPTVRGPAGPPAAPSDHWYGALRDSFLGHIVELEGTKGPLVARKSSRTCNVAAVCLRLAVLNPY